jgi:uncharacterized membrane protein YraQ (UPF0718 family)
MEKSDIKKLAIIAVFFVVFYFLPADLGRVSTALNESVQMMSEYAKAHVLLCLIPAFFIAGAISVFVKSNSVMKYLGVAASIVVAYSVASVSGAILAVCSCTVLPLFAGIYMRGAGLGPATAFLYSGPAINVLAIIMTARILGPELGAVRAIAAVLLSVIVGLLMAFIFRKEEKQRMSAFEMDKSDGDQVDLWRIVLLIGSMIGFLIFANWGAPQGDTGLWQAIYSIKWYAAGAFFIITVVSAFLLFKKEMLKKWLQSTLDYTLRVTPLLFIGVLVAGFLLGRPGHEALIPSEWISGLVGGNSIFSNLFASVSGALMYFATLTEVPILQGLIGAGMGKGPALALLLAGPALSLPSILVISKVLKWKKTLTYVGIVVVISTIAGIVYGLF